MEAVVPILGLVVGVIVILFKSLVPHHLKNVAVDGSKVLVEKLLGRIDREFGRLLGTDRAQNVVVQLGMGGAGKTTLIRQLIGDPNANADVETTTFSVYKRHSTIEGGDGRKIDTSVIIADYRGQDFSTLIRGILDHTKTGREFRAGNINTILFVIDIFPPGNPGRDQDMHEQPDYDRLRRNVQYWNEDKVQEIFNSFTDRGSLKNVILFVNKCDLLLARNRKELIAPHIEPLVSCIRRHTASLLVEPLVLYGSVKTGDGVWLLIDRILRTAVYA